MAGIEFRVARGDHLKVEDFVATQPDGLAGVQLEVTNLDRHVDLAVATAAAGYDVVIEPMTERLCHPGFNPTRLPFRASTRWMLRHLPRRQVSERW